MSCVTIAAPAPLTEVAKRIARALDPDSGGYESFSVQAIPDPAYMDANGNPAPSPCAGNALWAVCGTYCTEQFAAQVAYLQANPAALLGAVTQDYAIRFPDAPLPTLADVEAFCASAKLSYAEGIRAGCAELGLLIQGT